MAGKLRWNSISRRGFTVSPNGHIKAYLRGCSQSLHSRAAWPKCGIQLRILLTPGSGIAAPMLALVSFPSAASVTFWCFPPVLSPSLGNLEVLPLSFKQSVLPYADSPYLTHCREATCGWCLLTWALVSFHVSQFYYRSGRQMRLFNKFILGHLLFHILLEFPKIK